MVFRLMQVRLDSNTSDEAADYLHGLLLIDYTKYWKNSYESRGIGNSFYLHSLQLHRTR